MDDFPLVEKSIGPRFLWLVDHDCGISESLLGGMTQLLQ